MVHVIKKCTVFPAAPSEAQQIKLSSFDLRRLFNHYIQKGFFFKTPADDLSSYVERLAKTLSAILVKFYPLAGRLTNNPLEGGIYILCNDSGVDFIEATAENVSIVDLTTAEVILAVDELFALNGAVNFEGHGLPLLVIQVTRLKDGVAVCCTINHAVADGTSLWNFLNSWTHLCRTKGNGNGNEIPVDPIYDRSLLQLNGSVTVVSLGLDPDGQVQRSPLPPLRAKMFHFSAHMINRLKERANQNSACMISSFQALSAHVWRAVARARGLGPHERTTCNVTVNCRPRLLPPVPSSFFGSVVRGIKTTASCGELISLPLSFSAGLLNANITGHTNEVIREGIDKRVVDQKCCLVIGGSSRFEMYENDFGWGPPMVVRSGLGNRFDGKMACNPGQEGRGSVEIQLCLPPSVMGALESDPEFISQLAIAP